jgi:hypothetical protein
MLFGHRPPPPPAPPPPPPVHEAPRPAIPAPRAYVPSAPDPQRAASLFAGLYDHSGGAPGRQARHGAEQLRSSVEEESPIITNIMESKNEAADQVLNMMNAMFQTQKKVMAAGKAR